MTAILPLAPALPDAMGRLMGEYLPSSGAARPPFYADMVPASRHWPEPLRRLHEATVTARLAWSQAQTAEPEDAPDGLGDGRGDGLGARLCAVAYFALERECRAAIAAWVRTQDGQDTQDGETEARKAGASDGTL